MVHGLALPLGVVVLWSGLRDACASKLLLRSLHSIGTVPPMNVAEMPSGKALQVEAPEPLAVAIAVPDGSVTTSLDFANGYGTSFECTSVCHFITISFALAIGLFLILLLVIPVSTTNYVKSSSRKRVSKRPLDAAADELPYQVAPHAPPQALHSRDRRVANDVAAAIDDDIDTTDASRYDFIASLSAGPNDTQPLIKAIRTASMLSPRSQRLRTALGQSPLGAARAKQQHRGVAESAPPPAPSTTSYETLKDEEIQEAEYLEFVRRLSGDGIVLKRIKTKGRGVKIAKWRIRLTHDMMALHLSKQEGLHVLKKTESVQVKDIVGMTTGTLEAGGAIYLSLLQVDNSSLDFQADNEAMHQKMYNGFGMLLRGAQPGKT
ncbi:hypothetical protein H257_13503 [Aphanomyces astaci]|uniref:PH domain-containing protein n=2 Tax=Aphanomyces astaci TaxID=112090 RepID=W4FWE8_APHAT|nr:hypothetical protein H257_13503 [Aphanomyces astaci]ETV71099.1 hypothetical protein H257_13503 [Aphanomyces astaci]|eukprot:XP_009839345.1 hypothetical protein H257_13503 [Aphanomyces astaci]